MKLEPKHWYWSKSLKTYVKFIECTGNKAYVEGSGSAFGDDNILIGGAYLDQSDLFENSFDAILSEYKEKYA